MVSRKRSPLGRRAYEVILRVLIPKVKVIVSLGATMLITMIFVGMRVRIIERWMYLGNSIGGTVNHWITETVA
jgi:hypothetical protein